MYSQNEICKECKAITGNFGRDEDSLYIQHEDGESGPYCRKCYEIAKCFHYWIVTTDDNNFPEDVMCSKCKEVAIMVDASK